MHYLYPSQGPLALSLAAAAAAVAVYALSASSSFVADFRVHRRRRRKRRRSRDAIQFTQIEIFISLSDFICICRKLANAETRVVEW